MFRLMHAARESRPSGMAITLCVHVQASRGAAVIEKRQWCTFWQGSGTVATSCLTEQQHTTPVRAEEAYLVVKRGHRKVAKLLERVCEIGVCLRNLGIQ